MIITTTPRLLIRKLEMSDLEGLKAILGDKVVMEFSSIGALDEEGIRQWLKKTLSQYISPGFSVWGMVLKETEQLIGFAGIKPVELDGRMEIEIIFRLARNYWGQGYAIEAVRGVLHYAFNQLAVNNVIAVVEPNNVRSLRVIERLKMTYEKDSIYHGFFVRIYRLSKF